MKNIITTMIFVATLACSSYAQQFDLRFNLASIDCQSQQACYDVQVRSVNGSAFNLAGQNYRIYYDNSVADYVSGTSELSTADYGAFVVVQDIGPADATPFSNNLGFESTLGFLNYQIDLNDLVNGGITIPANADWVTTSNLCFSIDASVINQGAECIELVWAKENYTDNLATAFNEISQWVAPNDTDPVIPITAPTHDNLDSSDGDAACFTTSCSSPQPDISISDVLVVEGQAATVQICQSFATSTANTIVVSTVTGSASSADFAGFSNVSVVIPAGATCVDVVINTIDDTLVESSETFNVQIISSTDGNIVDGTSIVTINDNDVACAAQAPVISLD